MSDPRYDPKTPGLMRQAIEVDSEALDELRARFYDAALDAVNRAPRSSRAELVAALEAEVDSITIVPEPARRGR